MSSEESQVDEIVSTAFGSKNRRRLLGTYFDSCKHDVTSENAWEHVYRLLLWTDQTTGLAHCYESDKCQPGKRWYSRSLAFHDWLARALNSPPAQVGIEIDWMFQRAANELATEVARATAAQAARATAQRGPYKDRGFPAPGEDPDLISIVREVLGDHLASEPASEQWALLVRRVRQYMSLDNKRKNLLGEGFEDVLGTLVERSCSKRTAPIVHVRKPLHELPGFNRQRQGDKANKVDVAIIRGNMRTLVSAKWSVRADREKQFITDFNEYVLAESERKPFEYVFVTNEFDPARLARACENLVGNTLMFAHVVHINTDALRATYGDAAVPTRASDATIQKVLGYLDNGRLISLEKWLRALSCAETG